MVIWYPQTPNPVQGLRHATLNIANEGFTSPRHRRHTRDHIAFDEGCGGSFMNDTHFYDITLLCIFLWLVPNFRFVMVTFHPFFWYIYLFYRVFWHNTLTICVYSNIHCDFFGGTTTSRPNRWRTISFPPLHSQFVCSWLQKVQGLRHQGQSMY